jgi:hypothetical protein
LDALAPVLVRAGETPEDDANDFVLIKKPKDFPNVNVLA